VVAGPRGLRESAATMGWQPDRDALRGRVALASDPDRSRWNQGSVNSGQLASEYGFTDLDGSRPDIWRFIEGIREKGLDASHDDYR
jgi:hypothetical protein